jgi:uncharacterized protein
MSRHEILSVVKNFAKDNTPKEEIHGFPHVKRVLNLCLNIGKSLGANLKILEISALLHDIGRNRENQTKGVKNHAEISAEVALDFLKSKDFHISQNKLNNIIHCIRAHSFSNNVTPNTLEAKILSDADKLDALGAIGLFRIIGFTIIKQGGLGKVIEHLENKILKLKDQLYLDTSKQIAVEKHEIVLDFYNKIKMER